jgi:hypothetical protein
VSTDVPVCVNLRLIDFTRNTENRKLIRARSNTAHSYSEKFAPVEEEPPAQPPRPTIPKIASRTDSIRNDFPKISRTNSLRQDYGSRPDSPSSGYGRYNDDIPRSRDYSPDSNGRQSRGSNEPSVIYQRTPLRPLARSDDSPVGGSQESGSWTPTSAGGISNGGGVKKAPPPPPSRAKKPAPPPPIKRASYSTSQIPNSSNY